MKNNILRFMGLDLGDATIGIAFSDLLGITAQPYETYRRVSKKQDIDYLIDLIVEREIDTVVVGLPLHLNGDLGSQAEKTLSFIKSLEKKLKYSDKLNKEVNVLTEDERLSSMHAETLMREANLDRKTRAAKVDKLAAALILQNYMDFNQKK